MFDSDGLRGRAADEMIAAVDVADMLVRRGVPFRQSHGIVAALVREAVDSARTLSQLTPEELARHSEELDDEYYSVLSAHSWLESKVSEGGTASSRVREQLAHARAELDGRRRELYGGRVVEVAAAAERVVRCGHRQLIARPSLHHSEPAVTLRRVTARTSRYAVRPGSPSVRSYGIHALLNVVASGGVGALC